MKINVFDKFKHLDNNNGFSPKLIEEDEYNSYQAEAKNGFLITSKWIYYLYKKTSKENVSHFIMAISTYFEIKSCQQDITTKERSYCIDVFDGNDNISHTFDASILTSTGVKQLLANGCIYDECNQKHVLTYITVSATSAPIELVHTKLGWQEGKEPLFLSSECVSKNRNVTSKYIGNLDLMPRGNIQSTFDMIKNEVLGNSALEFALVASLVAPVLGYLNKSLDLGTLILNYCNLTSKGKTTAGMLIGSSFGNPAIGKSLVGIMNATTQSLLTFTANADSHPVILDELGTASNNQRNLIYQLASGMERKRNDRDGNNKTAKTFNSVIVVTSEHPIIDDTAPEGIRARVFQISTDICTSAENSDAIKKNVLTDFGHTGPVFVRFLIENKLDSMLDDYEKSYNYLIRIYENNDLEFGKLSKRVLSKLTVFLLTAQYMAECFEKIDINVEGIVKTIINLERSIADEQDVAEKALDCIRQYIATHKNHFIFENDDEYVSVIEGKIRRCGFGKEVTILKSVVEKVLSENGFDNPKIIYHAWNLKKILVTEKDRPYKRLRLSSAIPTLPCFVFKINE